MQECEKETAPEKEELIEELQRLLRAIKSQAGTTSRWFGRR